MGFASACISPFKQLEQLQRTCLDNDWISNPSEAAGDALIIVLVSEGHELLTGQPSQGLIQALLHELSCYGNPAGPCQLQMSQLDSPGLHI